MATTILPVPPTTGAAAGAPAAGNAALPVANTARAKWNNFWTDDRKATAMKLCLVALATLTVFGLGSAAKRFYPISNKMSTIATCVPAAVAYLPSAWSSITNLAARFWPSAPKAAEDITAKRSTPDTSSDPSGSVPDAPVAEPARSAGWFPSLLG